MNRQAQWRAQDFSCARCKRTILPSDLHEARVLKGELHHPGCHPRRSFDFIQYLFRGRRKS